MLFGEVNTEDITGTILYVSEGDLWQANPDGSERIKLIDKDTVTQGMRSSDGSNIAYDSTETVEEKVIVDDVINGNIVDKEETRSFIRAKLFVADPLGSNSIPVTLKPVSRFGWVPNSRLIWYEESELAYFYDWGYGSNGVIRLYDVDTRKTRTIIEQKGSVFSVQGLNFSPDGRYVAYMGDGLTVTALGTGITTKVFDSPYVGGDRGGPQPIPTFVWGPDAESLYTIFTPILFENSEEFESQSMLHKSGYVSAYQIFLDERKPKLLFEHKPAPIINDETAPRIAFSSDFRYALYYRYENEDIENLKDVYEWYYSGAKIPSAKLVVRDLETGAENVVVADLKMNHYLRPSELVADMVQLFSLVNINSELSLHISEFSTAKKTFEEKKFQIIADPNVLNAYQIGITRSKNIIYLSVASKLYAYDGTVVQEILEDAQNISFDLK